MQIWLDTNLQAHSFISQTYWQEHVELVESLLPQAEIYVYEDDNSHIIQGFLGMMDDNIEGIFVCSRMQSRGIGKQLLDYVKQIKCSLTLEVYHKNQRAFRFYQREQFSIQQEMMDEDTGEKAYKMVWKR
nr:GNAT family N-acetyltransferase [bacterium]